MNAINRPEVKAYFIYRNINFLIFFLTRHFTVNIITATQRASQAFYTGQAS